MAVSLTVPRDKLTPTTNVTADLTAQTATEATNSYFLRFTIPDQDPASFTVASCSTTNNSTTVTTTGNFLSPSDPTKKVKVGDAVSGTGIAGGTTVSAVTATQLTLSANATATGTVTLTFDGGSVSAPTAFAIGLVYTVTKNQVAITPTLYLYDGTLGATAGTTGNASQSIVLTAQDGSALVYNVDTALKNLRIVRS